MLPRSVARSLVSNRGVPEALDTVLQAQPEAAQYGVALHASDAMLLIYHAFMTREALQAVSASPNASNMTWLRSFLAEHADDLPDLEDIQGAAQSMLRLQGTYERGPAQLLPNAPVRLYQAVGEAGMEQEDWVSAEEWFFQAYVAVPPGEQYDELRATMAQWRIWCLYKSQRLPAAIALAEQLLAAPWMANVPKQRARVEDNLESFRARPAAIPLPRNYGPDNQLGHQAHEMALYRKLCRGEPTQTVRLPKLPCKYQTFGDPRFILQPVAVEQLADTPQDPKV